jgi:DNA-binding NarL/FixJ family response regulator
MTLEGVCIDHLRRAEIAECSSQDLPVATDIILIERQALVRDCLAHCLRLALGQSVRSFDSVASWLEIAGTLSASLVVLSTVGSHNHAEVLGELGRLKQSPEGPSIVILSDAVDDTDVVVTLLQQGARGYILTSDPLQVVIQAIRLVQAGGAYVPARSFVAGMRSVADPRKVSAVPSFSKREAAVVERLRLGKPNKIIAYELGMTESSVKIHIRMVMKKLKARNRTQVALMTNGYFDPRTAQPSG